MSAPRIEAGRRADAQRNRRRLLEAAARAFSERGIEVSAGEIARRAGVAKGTLFRHFSTKADLLEAVIAERMREMRELIAQIAAGRPPGLAAVAELMVRGAAVLAADRSFFDAAMAHSEPGPRLLAEKLQLEAALDELVAAAQRAGEVRGDVRGVDIAMLMMAATNTCAPSHDRSPELWRRYLALMIDGLRPGSTTPLAVAAVTGAPAGAEGGVPGAGAPASGSRARAARRAEPARSRRAAAASAR